MTAMANKHRSVSSRRVLTGFATLLVATTASTAQAAYYQVFTSTIPADVISSSDNYCSLAEAVRSINNGASVANCTDIDSTSSGMITLIEAPGKPYATHHYNIRNATLTLSRSVRIQPSSEGFRAFVDSSGALAFRVSQGVDVTISGVDINHTGSGSGRLISNAGRLALAETIVRNGKVSALTPGIGGGIYNERTGSLSLYGAQVLNNSAKKGGGIYNEDGNIPFLDAIISGNSATMAGGGLYNKFTGANPNAVVSLLATISSNSAKAGGGIANVGGEIHVFGATSITSNFTVSGTGSGEICHSGPCNPSNPTTCGQGPCDGNGGGVLNVDASSTRIAKFIIQEDAPTTVLSNTAVGFGGGFYNTGQLNISNVTVSGNRARSGAAIYAAALVTNGFTASNYCEVLNRVGPNSFSSNTATGSPSTSMYSIVDSSGATGTNCQFSATGSGNSNPRCNPAGVTSGYFCPQP